MRWLLVLFLLPNVSAHVPGFGEAGSSPGTAFEVDEPTKSWVFFDVLDGEHWFHFELGQDDELFMSLSTPPGHPAPALYLIRADDLGNRTQVPTVDRLAVEPFTPVALHTVAETRQHAPGEWYAVVATQQDTPYGLAIGGRESFTPVEWVRVPIDRIAIQAWAGIPAVTAFALETVALALVLWRWRGDTDVTIGRAGAAVTAASAGTTLLLTAIATAQAGASLGLLIPLGLSVAALGVGLGAWRATERGTPWTGLYAVGGLAVWAGLWLGPALLLAHCALRVTRRAS